VPDLIAPRPYAEFAIWALTSSSAEAAIRLETANPHQVLIA
jgi:hypothetical protein